VAESWFALSAEDQKEALAVAAAESGWPAYLLEKDIWVDWALQILGTDQQLLQSLTFKGGTSLSIDDLHALSGNLQPVPTDAGRQALESDNTAMADSGMLRGEFRSFRELLARISQLEQQCNAIARSLA
jgi:hypothetical protein